MKKLLVLIPLLAILAPAMLYFLSAPPSVTLLAPGVVGLETPVTVRVESPHGVRHIAAWVEQNGARQQVYEQSAAPNRLMFWRKTQDPADFKFNVGRTPQPALKDGKAKVIVEVQSNDLRAQSATRESTFEVISAPPKLAADGHQHYINQGGSELVVASVSGYWTEVGLRAGPYTFRSFPLPGSQTERFVLFAYPWDLPPDTKPIVYAKNPGAETTATFWHKVFPKPFRSRDLEIDDAFLEKVVNQLDPGGAGTLVDRFLRINGGMRKKNNQTLADLRLKTAEKFLWKGPFLQLANSKVESQFADRRSYFYNGKKIDEQTHLGFDLSVTQHVDVAASNDGRVVYAADLGIYGNCVVVDHGYGLQSIYAHLSEIGVKDGEMVTKGQSLGKSGATGLAGGDHLHFSMQVDGVQVNPVEWWDDHWITDRIRSKIKE